MKALIAIMTVALVYVACTRKDETPAPAPEAPAPVVESAPPVAPPAETTAPAPAADPHAGHDHAPGTEHK